MAAAAALAATAAAADSQQAAAAAAAASSVIRPTPTQPLRVDVSLANLVSLSNAAPSLQQQVLLSYFQIFFTKWPRTKEYVNDSIDSSSTLKKSEDISPILLQLDSMMTGLILFETNTILNTL